MDMRTTCLFYEMIKKAPESTEYTASYPATEKFYYIQEIKSDKVQIK